MCIASAAKCVLLIVNIVFGLLGGTLAIIGALLKWGTPLLFSLVSDYISSLPYLSDLGGLGSFDAAGLSIDLEIYTGSAGLAFLLVGLVLLAFCFVGCCGACCESRILLTVYAIVLGVLAGVKIALWLFYVSAWSTIEAYMISLLTSTITSNYAGIQGTDPTSIIWNVVNVQFKCCGVSNYTDFYSATNWQRTVTLNQSISGVNVVQNASLATPFSCCKVTGTFPQISLAQYNCSYAPSTDNSNYETSCWNTLSTSYVTPYKWYISVVWLGIIATEVVLMILSIYICCSAKSALSPV